jgi:hypothetical protein
MKSDPFTTIKTPTEVFPGQYRWDLLEYEDQGMSEKEARIQALTDRNRLMKIVRKSRPDLDCRGCTLTGQLRQYRSFGCPDGRVRNVYYLNVFMKGQDL